MKTLVTPLVIVLLGGLVGCVPQEETSVATSDERLELYNTRRENERLQKEIDQLEKQLEVQTQKCADLEKRGRRMSKELFDLKRDNEKLQSIIDHLKTLPEQRDRYKAEAETCKKQVARLEMENRRLKKKIDQLEAASGSSGPE